MAACEHVAHGSPWQCGSAICGIEDGSRICGGGWPAAIGQESARERSDLGVRAGKRTARRRQASGGAENERVAWCAQPACERSGGSDLPGSQLSVIAGITEISRAAGGSRRAEDGRPG